MGSRQGICPYPYGGRKPHRPAVDGKELLACTDEESPYLTGSVGMSVTDGSHCLYRDLAVCGKE